MQLLLATIALSVFAGLASHTVGGRVRFAIGLLAVGITATYAFFPRYM
jgi:1,4-dihydroxy-2-naphthoate octaprenyltransferase